jgi:hypothetical protein
MQSWRPALAGLSSRLNAARLAFQAGAPFGGVEKPLLRILLCVTAQVRDLRRTLAAERFCPLKGVTPPQVAPAWNASRAATPARLAPSGAGIVLLEARLNSRADNCLDHHPEAQIALSEMERLGLGPATPQPVSACLWAVFALRRLPAESPARGRALAARDAALAAMSEQRTNADWLPAEQVMATQPPPLPPLQRAARRVE